MTAPNMAAITASLERSLQSFSLNHHNTITTTSGAASQDSPTTHFHRSSISDDATLELNSNITLPYRWEQCLDLETGEVYYINWRTGIKTKDDPRTVDDGFSGYFYSDDNDEDEAADEESSYDESSVESSPAVSSSRKENDNEEKENEQEESSRIGGNNVLVVAGCKGCFMYFMVPKQVEDCPKCCGQLLHFDRSNYN